MDTTCGISTDLRAAGVRDLPDPRPAHRLHASGRPHKDVFGFAECYRVTENVIFTRGYAYQDDPRERLPMWSVHSCAWAKGAQGDSGLKQNIDGAGA